MSASFRESLRNAMTTLTSPRKRIQMYFDVATDHQAAELSAAWEDIVSGKRTRISAAAEDTQEVIERARLGLQRIVKAIEEHPGTGRARRLERFLNGAYNGHDFPLDLTDLRTLDAESANASVDYFNYDRLAKAEVHSHLPEGGSRMGFLSNAGFCHALICRSAIVMRSSSRRSRDCSRSSNPRHWVHCWPRNRQRTRTGRWFMPVYWPNRTQSRYAGLPMVDGALGGSILCG
jgi:hypothetical protein